ncbi:hypothetical protein [Pseudoalteromonas sp. BDTF-M6]|uniref:hypothetical protein n=1 Tax=Pseudoalteromonas sp. BDTF-M6 TaxID=2796132 RepID=UPI001BB0AF50|nr:hypothetical protein [Pseudoalteromonas sp. BDTF-M6]MBS3796683.1 hypothetical protein [Pseudoalteromonas sp. BDTF-M6]
MHQIQSLILVVFAATVIGIAALGYGVNAIFFDSKLEEQAKAAIEACERELPRSQKCVLSAVPVE